MKAVWPLEYLSVRGREPGRIAPTRRRRDEPAYWHKLCIAALITSLGTFVASLAGWGGGDESNAVAPSAGSAFAKDSACGCNLSRESHTRQSFPWLAGRGYRQRGSKFRRRRSFHSRPFRWPLTTISVTPMRPSCKCTTAGKWTEPTKSRCTVPSSPPSCPPPNPQFKYVNPSEVAPYFQLAEQYTFADRMFQTNQGPSFPAHQFHYRGDLRAYSNQQFVRCGESSFTSQ